MQFSTVSVPSLDPSSSAAGAAGAGLSRRGLSAGSGSDASSGSAAGTASSFADMFSGVASGRANAKDCPPGNGAAKPRNDSDSSGSRATTSRRRANTSAAQPEANALPPPAGPQATPVVAVPIQLSLATPATPNEEPTTEDQAIDSALDGETPARPDATGDSGGKSGAPGLGLGFASDSRFLSRSYGRFSLPDSSVSAGQTAGIESGTPANAMAQAGKLPLPSVSPPADLAPGAASAVAVPAPELARADAAPAPHLAHAESSDADVEADPPASGPLSAAGQSPQNPSPPGLSAHGFALPANRAEIFAGRETKTAALSGIANRAADKSFLTPDKQNDANHVKSPGTGVAISDGVMPATSAAHSSAPAADLGRAVVATHGAGVGAIAASSGASADSHHLPGFVSDAGASADAANQPQSVPSAQHAVEAVLTAAERVSSGDRHSVHLQFSVGDADLDVRVELRGGEVRTTFHTDSPELREALAHEWQAVTADSGDRSARLATPTFTSQNSSAFSATAGDGGAHSRDTAARRGAEEQFSLAGARSSRGSATSADVSLPVATPRAALLSSGRLSTLA